MHGTENTFYLLDCMSQPLSDNEMREMTLKWCQDEADGFLFVHASAQHVAKMRIFNEDGTEPEMCGNGLRCFARYVLEKFDLSEGTIETLKTSYHVRLLDDFYGIPGIQITLYPVKTYDFEDVESFLEKGFTYYNVSNPHIVGVVQERMSVASLTDLGIDANEHFKDGINVNLMHIMDRGKIYVQTYERGVGITKSCGTGMTSSSVHYARVYDYFDQPIEVYNDGGMIECLVEKREDYAVRFTGNATYISQHDKDGTLLKVYDEAKEYQQFYMKTRSSSV